MIKFIIIFFSLIVFSCATTENETASKNTNIIHELERSHFQNVSLKTLKELLQSNKLSIKDKDFIRYYILSYVDDVELRAFLEKEENNSTSNIFSILTKLNKINSKDTHEINSLLTMAYNLEPNNEYVLLEKHHYCINQNERTELLILLSKIAPFNELAQAESIVDRRESLDSINYNLELNYFKKEFDNYYSNLFIGGEYIQRGYIDSAFKYFNRSLKQKKTIGVYLQLSDMYYKFLNDYEKSNEYMALAMKINNHDEDALVMKAWHYYMLRDTVTSKKILDELVATRPDVENYKEILMFYFSQNDLQNAKRVYEVFIKNYIDTSEQAGYFLTFEALNNKNNIVLDERIDSIEKIHGLLPIGYSSRLLERVFELRNGH